MARFEGKCVICSAPSGAGKTTIVQHLLRNLPELSFSVSATSRPMRPNERADVDYHFLSPEEFARRISEGAFVEWEEVYPGRFYGTLRSEVERIWASGKHIVFDVDVVGGLHLKERFGAQALALFIEPPSLEVLAERLLLRGTETAETLRVRVDKATHEMETADRFDAVVVNHTLDQACAEALALVRNFLGEMTIACLFGTFDPPHNGHLSIARRVLEESDVDQLWLVITPMNPFKQDQAISADEHRVAMVRAAVQGETGIVVSTEELRLPSPNYTADTLVHFRKRWPEHRFRLVMGSDNLAQLDRWKDPQGILEHHAIVVYPRPGYDLHRNQSSFADHPGVSFLEGAVMDLSSTRIRQAVREGRSIGHWVNPLVASYIAANGLYKD